MTAAYTLTRGAFAGKAGREAATKGADREQQYVGGSAIMMSSMHPHLKAEFEGIKGNLRANHQHEAAAVLELDHALVAVYDVDSVGQACHQGTPPTFAWSLFLMSLVHEQTPCECAAAISMESKPCVGMSDLAVGSRQAQVACVRARRRRPDGHFTSANDMSMHGVLAPNPKQDQDRYVPDVPEDQVASTGDRHYVHLHMSLPLSFHTDDVLKVRLSSYI